MPFMDATPVRTASSLSAERRNRFSGKNGSLEIDQGIPHAPPLLSPAMRYTRETLYLALSLAWLAFLVAATVTALAVY